MPDQKTTTVQAGQDNTTLVQVATKKSPLLSMTLWFNLLIGVGEAAQAISGAHILPPNTAIVVALIGNFLLRLKTSQPVSF